MDTAGRRDQLIQLMRRRGQTSVSALADELEVSRRTVLRDLAVFRERGFHIDAEGGRGGGVLMDPGSVLVSAHLGVDEVVALILAVATLRATPWMPLAGPAENALSKIERSRPADRLRALRRVLRRILVGEAAEGAAIAVSPVDPRLLLAFERAFRERRVLAFSYVDREGRTSTREVKPQALLVRAPLWYIIAWDPARDGLRLFRMDRVQDPHVLDGTFVERPLDLVLGVCPDAKPPTSRAG